MTTARPALVIIAAVARNGVIGGANKLLWRLPTDLRRFKATTLGKPVVMGRKTFESIGRPLPGRETIVVTHDRDFAFPDVRLARSIEQAVALGAECASALGVEEVMIAGGGQVYSETIGRADRLALTEVALAPEGDTLFPRLDPRIWRETERERGVRSAGDETDFDFVLYARRN